MKPGVPVRTGYPSTPRVVTQVHYFLTVNEFLCFWYKPILSLHTTVVILLLAHFTIRQVYLFVGYGYASHVSTPRRSYPEIGYRLEHPG